MWRLFCKYWILFLTGGILYILLEILYRGRTHWTMFILGGLCFVAVGRLNETFSDKKSMLCLMFMSSVVITSLELAGGLILNVWLGMRVWDYSRLPFNFMGQICLPFSAVWFFLSVIIMLMYDVIRWKLFMEEKPKKRLSFKRERSLQE